MADRRAAQLHFRKGATAYNRGNHAAAEAAFTAGLAMDDQSAPAFLFRGLCRLRLSKIDDALNDLHAALNCDPSLADAAWARGRILADRGDWKQAARDFGRVIAANPDEPRGYAARGEMFYRLRLWRHCLEDYSMAVRLHPHDPPSLNRLAWVLATCPLDELRDGSQAAALADRANHLTQGSDPLICDTLAVALAECGRFDEAVAIYETMTLQDWPAEFTAHRCAFAAGQPWRDTIPHPGP